MAYVLNNPKIHTSSITIPVNAAGSITNSGNLTGTVTAGGYATTASTITLSGHTYNPKVNIDSTGIQINDDADLKIGDMSLKDTLQAIQDRLAILTPDPAKLEKYAALKQAYEHYRLLEKLCNEGD